MAKSSKDRDRRAVVEQMRRDQQRSERRRTIAVISACLVVGALIIGFAAVPLLQQRSRAAKALSDLGAGAGSCQDVVKKKATGNQEHRDVGTTVDYQDAPPAFGPHYPTPAPFGRTFYAEDDRPEVEYLVHNLEHGYTLLWYDDTVAEDEDQLNAVKAIAAKFEGNGPTSKFIAVPWTAEDGKAFPAGQHVALTHWSVGGDAAKPSQQGVWQYCEAPSGAAVDTFTKNYPYSDSPEPNAA